MFELFSSLLTRTLVLFSTARFFFTKKQTFNTTLFMNTHYYNAIYTRTCRFRFISFLFLPSFVHSYCSYSYNYSIANLLHIWIFFCYFVSFFHFALRDNITYSAIWFDLIRPYIFIQYDCLMLVRICMCWCVVHNCFSELKQCSYIWIRFVFKSIEFADACM